MVISKYLNNKRGNMFVYLILMIFIFIVVISLVFDFTNVGIKSKKIKYGLNNSVKAAALQIQEGEELSEGKFLIDETLSEEAFKKILAHNLGLDENSLEPLKKSLVYEKPIIKEFHVENNTPTEYYSTTLNRNIKIEHPTVIAVIEFKVKGSMIKRTIQVAKLSSGQLKSVYE